MDNDYIKFQRGGLERKTMIECIYYSGDLGQCHKNIEGSNILVSKEICPYNDNDDAKQNCSNYETYEIESRVRFLPGRLELVWRPNK